jgi:RecG-like helicase
MSTLLREQKLQIKEEMIDNPLVNLTRIKSKETLTIAILGDKGSGKTLLMAIIGLLFHFAGFDFYTNFWIDENITHKKDFSISQLYNNPNVSGIFLDECHNIADQNSNRTSETKLLTALFTQSRKRGQLILLSSLHFYKIAKDLRYLTSVIAYPELNKENDLLTVQFWNLEKNKVVKTYIPNVSRFFKYYDTYEIIVDDSVKNQLSSYLLKNVKIQEEIKKKLGKEDQKIIKNMERNLKNEGRKK